MFPGKKNNKLSFYKTAFKIGGNAVSLLGRISVIKMNVLARMMCFYFKQYQFLKVRHHLNNGKNFICVVREETNVSI